MSQERARHHITTSGVRVPSYMHIFRNDSYVRPKVDGWSWLGGWFGGKGCVSVCVWGEGGKWGADGTICTRRHLPHLPHQVRHM